MSFFTTETLDVDLGGGNTVTLKRLTAGEASEARSAATSKVDLTRGRRGRSQKPGQEEDIEIVLDLHRLVLERLARAVVAWEGEGFMENGALVPVTVENVKRLPESVLNRLQEGMGIVNPADDSEGEEEKNEP